ncbi:ABC transporter substrate-binding protein [Bradyrhizobium yuanmingense]|uniref:ABC transporter substrate-binding protein n=1 Tax=Bradyrhizobium yuanmingense TaxID=108015 RepID=UPI0023B92780|nr:ABC transporter substrate-binding protein [Bradyrhizobium yuanmingense]MDF0495152.1 ABC transporter substrate-binding protein [Bradyrhizobium yuanmingense]
MKRREFIAGTAALLVSPWRLWAQGTSRRIGFLANFEYPPLLEVWRSSLHERGWIEGKNVTIDYRYSAGRAERLTALATELVTLKPDLIVCSSPQPAAALKAATATIPIVFVAVADPEGLGLVQSLSRPGGNITGLATLVPEDFLAKRIEMLRELVPSASKIAILVNPDNPFHQKIPAEYVPRTAPSLGVSLMIVEATTAEGLDAAFAAAAAEHVDAIIDVGDPMTLQQAPRIVALAAKYHLPANYFYRASVAAGGLIAYSPDFLDMHRRAAEYVDKILRGTKPSDLPVERPTKYELVINMKTAKALGLTVPPSLLVGAEVIE